LNSWGANQGSDGAINTLVEPSIANLERKANDSTPLWLMWALRNRARFGSTLAMDKVHRAAEYFLRTYDRHHNGTCWAQFVMGQLDVIDYPEGTTDICENQGMFAVTLRVIKELRIAGVSNRISDDYIERLRRRTAPTTIQSETSFARLARLPTPSASAKSSRNFSRCGYSGARF